MTLARPIPDAEDPVQQRLELELLMQQAVPGPEQLRHWQQLLQDGNTGLDADRWRALSALPIAIDDDHLDIAVPSHWDEEHRTEFLAQHPGNGRRIRLHRTLDSDLKAALQETETDDSVEPVQPPPPSVDRALEETAATYLEEFTVDGVLEESPEEKAEQSSNTIDLEASLRDADASPVVSLVDRILLQAMSVGASDIHVEPQQK